MVWQYECINWVCSHQCEVIVNGTERPSLSGRLRPPAGPAAVAPG